MSNPNKLRTSREVYHRLKWDPSFDESFYRIGIQERFSGEAEIPLNEFVPDGEIPWHRVWYFSKGGVRVWDRKTRLDRIFGSGDPNANAAASYADAVQTNKSDPMNGYPRVEKIPGFFFHACSNTWVLREDSQAGGSPRSSLRCVSWNVLFDWYNSEKIYSEERWARLIHRLKDSDAEVIALQEVTEPFHRMLMAQAWVRASYVVSDVPGGATVSPHGSLLLVLQGACFYKLAFSTSKQAILADLGPSFANLVVATVHLASNREDHPLERRVSQMEELLAQRNHPALQESRQWLVLGDFNTRAGEPVETVMTQEAFRDLWLAQHPDVSGDTFVPNENPLAALNSRSGRSGRLDRAYLLDREEGWSVFSTELLGNSPYTTEPEPRFPSDHWGLQVVMEHSSTIESTYSEGWNEALFVVEPTYRTACMVAPPQKCWEPIQSLREKYDPSYERWMPHINLLFGFLPESLFDAASAALSVVLDELPSFRVTLRHFRWFEQKKSLTCWLEPETEPPGILEDLQSRLEVLFPTCSQQSERSEQGFTPHLTVATFRKSQREEAMALQRSWSSQWEPVSWTVDSIALISRREEEPFEVRHVVSLGGANPKLIEAGCIVSDEESTHESFLSFLTQRPTDQERLQDVWTSAVDAARFALRKLGLESCSDRLEVYGSFALGAAHAASDVDGLWFLKEELPLRRLAIAWVDELSKVAPVLSQRWESSTQFPKVELVWNGITLEITFLFSSSLPVPLNSDGRDKLSYSTLHHAEQGFLDANHLQEWVVLYDLEDIYPDLLWVVRKWAHSHGLSGKAFGFLSGLAWSVWVAYACKRTRESNSGLDVLGCFVSFLRKLSRWKKDNVIALDLDIEYRRDQNREQAIVLSPTGDENLARSLTSTTWNRILDVALRSLRVVENNPTAWKQCFVPVGGPSHTFLLPMKLTGVTREELEQEKGIVTGKLLGQILAFEKRSGLCLYPKGAWDVVQDGDIWCASLELVVFREGGEMLERAEVMAATTWRDRLQSTLCVKLR